MDSFISEGDYVLSVDVQGSYGSFDVGDTFLLSDQLPLLPRFNQDL
jgi:hypothetical protein